MKKQNKGITLIALVITIIILLILAGISISSIVGSGLFNKAKEAKFKSIQAQYEEELNLVIIDMRTDTVSQNVSFNMEYIIKKLPEYLDKEEKADYEWNTEQTSEEPEGEYKGYIFYIDKDYIAHIEAEANGIRPDIEGRIVTEGYVLEGDIIEIEVKATISEGKVEIIAPKGITVKQVKNTDREKIYVYSVDRNDTYLFEAKGDSGRRNKESIVVDRILSKPQINISNNAGGEVTINVENSYPEDIGIKYTYYLGTIEKESNDKNCTIDNLAGETTYKAKVVMTYNGKNLESDEIIVVTTRILTSPIIKLAGGSGRVALAYPLLTKDGVMTCYSTLLEGDKVTLKIENTEANVTNYYSCDNGENWIRYESEVEIVFPGTGNLLAKSVSSEGLASLKISTIEVEKRYYYDVKYQARAGDALGYGAYDGNVDSWACDIPYQVNNNNARSGTGGMKKYIEIDKSAIGKQVTLTYQCASSDMQYVLTVQNQSETKELFRKDITPGLEKLSSNVVITNEMKWIRFEVIGDGTYSHARVYEVNVK